MREDGRLDFAPVPCACKQRERAARAAARLQSDLGTLVRSRWEHLQPGRSWAPAQRQSFGACVCAVREFAASPEGALLLTGTTGCGKTTLLACAANDLLASGRVPLFAVVPDLLDRLRASFDPKAEQPFDDQYEDLKRADVLLLDDFGAEHATSWALEKLYQLVDYRYRHRPDLPLLVSTNLAPNDLRAFSPRIYSRLIEGGYGRLLVNAAPDYRERGDQ